MVERETGKELLGFGGDGLTATAEEIESFLRQSAFSTWKASAAAEAKTPTPAPAKAKDPKPKKAEAPRPKPEPLPEPERDPEPEPEPQVTIREARPKDAGAMAELIRGLGYEASKKDVAARLRLLTKDGEPPLVAELDGLVGCLTWHVMEVLHRPAPVGRITIFVVGEEVRGRGIGTALAEAAEARLREAGCGLIEVTSNMKRFDAHRFYRKLGYEQTSFRFAKCLSEN